jgi:serine/threonine-protein kinase
MSESVELPVELGQTLAGKYRLERVLGVGGMGAVVEATHVLLEQPVAIKFLLRTALKDEASVTRFEREAKASVRLRSQHVVRVMDVGKTDDGIPYMVMEMLVGKDLAAVISERGPLPVPEAVDYFTQICDAVYEAHQAGIVHRDLKPENVFVTRKPNGEPLLKVLDFGISKMAGEAQLSLTNTTQVMGSPYYMSPEQLRSARNVDHRADIWSLGAIFYEMLTANVPFEAESMIELVTKVVEEFPPPIQSLRNDVPPEVLATVDGCLKKRKEERFESVRDVLRALKPGAPSLVDINVATDVTGSHRTIVSPQGVVRPGEKSMTTHTLSAWDGPGSPAAAARRTRLFVLGGIGGVLMLALVGGAVAVAMKSDGKTAHEPMTSDVAHSTANAGAGTATVATTTTTTATATDTTPVVSLSALPTSTATAPRPTGTSTAAPIKTASAKPTATKNDDDLPTSRR